MSSEDALTEVFVQHSLRDESEISQTIWSYADRMEIGYGRDLVSEVLSQFSPQLIRSVIRILWSKEITDLLDQFDADRESGLDYDNDELDELERVLFQHKILPLEPEATPGTEGGD